MYVCFIYTFKNQYKNTAVNYLPQRSIKKSQLLSVRRWCYRRNACQKSSVVQWHCWENQHLYRGVTESDHERLLVWEGISGVSGCGLGSQQIRIHVQYMHLSKFTPAFTPLCLKCVCKHISKAVTRVISPSLQKHRSDMTSCYWWLVHKGVLHAGLQQQRSSRDLQHGYSLWEQVGVHVRVTATYTHTQQHTQSNAQQHTTTHSSCRRADVLLRDKMMWSCCRFG